MTQTLSIKDTRNNLADIISRVEIAGDEIIITKFGKPRARIVPIIKTQPIKSAIRETAGAWSHRKDIKNTAKWVRDLRAKMSIRHE